MSGCVACLGAPAAAAAVASSPSTAKQMIPAKRTSSGRILCAGHARQSFWNIRCFCVFSYMPDVLISHGIFGFLSHAELALVSVTCKRWNFLAQDKWLWKHVDIQTLPFNISQDVLASLLMKHSNSIENLKLCDAVHLSTQTLNVVGELVKLKELHLCNIPAVSDVLVQKLIQCCPRLSDLYLGGCKNISDVAFEGAKHSRLKSVAVRGCSSLTSGVFDFLPSSLNSLNMTGCIDVLTGFSAESVRSFFSLEVVNLHGVNVDDEFLAVLVQGSKSITKLAISSSNPFMGSLVTDVGLSHVASLSGLVDLNIMGARKVTDWGVFMVSQGCSMLLGLCIGFCSKITDVGVGHIAQGCTRLRYLMLFQSPLVTDEGIRVLSHHASNLELLDITGCVRLTRQSLDYMNQGLPSLKRLSAKLSSVQGAADFQLLRSQRNIEIEHL